MFNDGRMCVFIRKDAYEFACSFSYTSPQFRNLMRIYQGTWLDVDTDHLFRDQFNVKTRQTGWVRIPAQYVSQVRNDARIGKKICLNCGKSSVYKDSLGRVHNSCPNCKMDYQFHVFRPEPSTNGVIC